MEITLSPEDQQLIENLIAKGEFTSADDVIKTSLSMMQKEEAWKSYVRDAIDEGMKQALAGDFASDGEIDALFAKYRQKTA